jgi:hypothetical protein
MEKYHSLIEFSLTQENLLNWSFWFEGSILSVFNDNIDTTLNSTTERKKLTTTMAIINTGFGANPKFRVFIQVRHLLIWL